MNRYVFSFMVVAITVVPAAHAQASAEPMAMDSGAAMHGKHADSSEHAMMMAKLNLTEAQMKRARVAGQSNMAGMAGKTGMGNMHGKDNMMAQGMAEVRAVLTPSQQKEFDTMVAEHKKQRDVLDHGKGVTER